MKDRILLVCGGQLRFPPQSEQRGEKTSFSYDFLMPTSF